MNAEPGGLFFLRKRIPVNAQALWLQSAEPRRMEGRRFSASGEACIKSPLIDDTQEISATLTLDVTPNQLKNIEGAKKKLKTVR